MQPKPAQALLIHSIVILRENGGGQHYSQNHVHVIHIGVARGIATDGAVTASAARDARPVALVVLSPAVHAIKLERLAQRVECVAVTFDLQHGVKVSMFVSWYILVVGWNAGPTSVRTS